MPNIALAKAEPPSRRNFLLREKLNAFLPLHVQIPEKGLIPAIEWKPGHGCRHADIDPDHAALDSMFEFPGCFA